MPCWALLVAIVLLPVASPAVDRPLAGHSLTLTASLSQPGRRTARVIIRDPAVASPFPDLTAAPSALIISAGAAAGQCRVEVALDPANWHAIGGAGGEQGYRYVDRAGATMGIGRIVLRPGLIALHARGDGWPCDLSATVQRTPVSVVLRIDDTRYCAAFDDSAAVNRAGRFHARSAPAPSQCPDNDLTVANLNILHGIFCPGDSHACRVQDRIDLLFEWIVAAGCPDVITLQEVWSGAVALIRPKLATVCPFSYQEVFFDLPPPPGLDGEMMLTHYPAVDSELTFLHPGFRHVTSARIDHPIGPVDVFTTHLASSSDNAQGACGMNCPAECVAAGAQTIRECQGVQLAALVASRHDSPAPAVVTGDFNVPPGSFVYEQMTGRGWTDTYLAAGNPECEPVSGMGCTSGRADEDLSQLESPVSNENERIDYIFVVPPRPGSLCSAAVDSGEDGDLDGTATRIFADEPNPFAATCGPAPAAICWPSDHEGMQLDLNCE